MNVFTEQMEALTNEVLLARRERAACVAHVQEQAHRLRADAQSFVQRTDQEQHAQAEQDRKARAADCRERSSQVREMRRRNGEGRRAMRQGLKEMLQQTHRNRQQHLERMREAFHAAQQQLASDLHQAGKTWRAMRHGKAKPVRCNP